MSKTEIEEPTSQERSTGRRVAKEVAIVAAFYFLYSTARNLNGSAKVGQETAFLNAERVIEFERHLSIYHERAIQQFFLAQHWIVWIMNVFYSSAHFIVTIGVLVWMFLSYPKHYRFWRNTLAICTGLALLGFALFPLLPPRLLPPSYGFEDTLKTIGGLWNFESGPVHKVSNQFAAMPSLHFAWSSWCGLIIYRYSSKRIWKAAGIAYPVLTLLCIVATANHYIADAFGGAAALAIALALAWKISPLPRVRHHDLAM